jgi:hypothetical protein
MENWVRHQFEKRMVNRCILVTGEWRSVSMLNSPCRYRKPPYTIYLCCTIDRIGTRCTAACFAFNEQIHLLIENFTPSYLFNVHALKIKFFILFLFFEKALFSFILHLFLFQNLPTIQQCCGARAGAETS